MPRSITGTWRLPRSPIGAVLLVTALSFGPDEDRADPIGDAVSDAGFATLTVDPHWFAGNGDRGGTVNLEAMGAAVATAAGWLARQPVARGRPIGVIGWGQDAPATLWAAVKAADTVGAVVCQAGSSEETARALPTVCTPTLLAVGSATWDDTSAARMALDQMKAPHRMVVMPGVGEAGAAAAELPVVGRLAARWFTEQLAAGLR